MPDLRDRFADPRQRLDCDIYLAWVMRIPAADKPNKPLAWNWSYGPGFFDSLDEVQGVEREKVAQVMLEVVLGLDKDLAGRGLHQLRAGDGGADPKRRTAEGIRTGACIFRSTPPAHAGCITSVGPMAPWSSAA